MPHPMQDGSHAAPPPEGDRKQAAQAFAAWTATRPAPYMVKTDVTITRPGRGEWISMRVGLPPSDQEPTPAPLDPMAGLGGGVTNERLLPHERHLAFMGQLQTIAKQTMRDRWQSVPINGSRGT